MTVMVYQYVQGKNDCDDDDEGDTLAEFTYSTDGPPIQEFEVKLVSMVHKVCMETVRPTCT